MRPLDLILLAGFIGLLAIVSFNQNASAVELEWTMTLDDSRRFNDVAMTDDGELIVAGVYKPGPPEKHLVHLYNQTGDLLVSKTFPNWTTHVAISSLGDTIMVASSWGQVYLFDNLSSDPLWEYEVVDGILEVEMTPDGQHVGLVGVYSQFILLDRNGTELWNTTDRIGVRYFAMADDVGHIAMTAWDGDLYLVAGNGTVIWQRTGHSSMKYVDISAKGGSIVVSDSQDGFYLYNRTGSQRWFVDTGQWVVDSVAVSADGSHVAIGTRYEVLLLTKSSLLLVYYDDTLTTRQVALNRDGSFLAASIYSKGLLFTKESSIPISSLDYPAGQWPDLSLTPDGRYMLQTNRNLLHYLWTGDQTVSIGAIAPEPASETAPVHFMANVSDGLPLRNHEWVSDLDGRLSNAYSFNTTLSPGLHTISFRVRSWQGLWSAPVSSQLLVHERPVAHLAEDLPAWASQGQKVELSGNGSGPLAITGYEWASDLDGVFATTNLSNSSSLRPGDHQIIFRVHDVNGAWSEPVTMKLHVNARPIATILGTDPVAAFVGGNLTLLGAGTDVDGIITTYEWDLLGDGKLIFGESSPTAYFTYSQQGNMTVKLRVQDNDDIWSEPAELTFYVTTRPQASLVSIEGKAQVGEVVLLTASGTDKDGSLSAYRWDPYGDGRLTYTTTNATLEFIYPAGGSYTVRLWVQDDDGAWSEAAQQTIKVAAADDSDGDYPLPLPLIGLGVVVLLGIAGMVLWKRGHGTGRG